MRIGWQWLSVLALTACGRLGMDAAMERDPALHSAAAGRRSAPRNAAASTAPAPGCVVPEPVDAGCVPTQAPSNGAYPSGSLWLQMEDPDPAMGIHVDDSHGARCSGRRCPAPVAGVHGNGFLFSGQQVQIEWAPDLDGSAGYTVGVWARLDAYPQGTLDHSFACALAKPNSSGRLGNGESYALCVNSSHLVYDYTTSDSESHMLVGQGARAEIAELGRWHHLAATWDATCRTKTLYVDGCRVNASVADVGFDRSPVVVGSDTTSPSSWSGALDDVLIYDRALGDADIKQLVAGTASL